MVSGTRCNRSFATPRHRRNLARVAAAAAGSCSSGSPSRRRACSDAKRAAAGARRAPNSRTAQPAQTTPSQTPRGRFSAQKLFLVPLSSFVGLPSASLQQFFGAKSSRDLPRRRSLVCQWHLTGMRPRRMKLSGDVGVRSSHDSRLGATERGVAKPAAVCGVRFPRPPRPTVMQQPAVTRARGSARVTAVQSQAASQNDTRPGGHMFLAVPSALDLD